MVKFKVKFKVKVKVKIKNSPGLRPIGVLDPFLIRCLITINNYSARGRLGLRNLKMLT